MPMTEQQWTALARYLRDVVPRAAPDWTVNPSQDPGVTVLEVLNYALTDLELRRPPDDTGRSLARAVASQAAAVARAYGSNAPRVDPYRNFKFRVKWDGRYVAGVSKVSALERTTEAVEFREGGDASPTRRMPGPTRYGAITLERGLTHDREFEAWATADAGSSSSKDVVVELYDEAGQLFTSYRVSGCWVSQYQALPDLDADRETVLIERLRLECDRWERLDPA